MCREQIIKDYLDACNDMIGQLVVKVVPVEELGWAFPWEHHEEVTDRVMLHRSLHTDVYISPNDIRLMSLDQLLSAFYLKR